MTGILASLPASGCQAHRAARLANVAAAQTQPKEFEALLAKTSPISPGALANSE